MKGLDLSKLKKVSSDDKMTVFRHGSGHEVKIAHAGLSPKLLKEIQNIPTHGQKMADGGEPSPQPTEDQDNPQQPGQPPINININGQPGANASPPGQVAQPNNSPLEIEPIQKAQAPQVQAAPQEDAGDDASDGQPQPGAGAPQQKSGFNLGVDTNLSPPQKAYQDTSQDLDKETAAWAQDLNSGHVTPENYSDLFAKKSTLGKIGMIFGLMVGGAGAGLAGQQNALLSAMNQEVNNDLEAQKLSKSNAQNWLKLQQQQQQINSENKVRTQQAGLIGAQSRSTQMQTDINATTLAKNQIDLAVLHGLYQKTGMLPEGPQKQAAMQVLGNVAQGVDQGIAQRNHQASMAAAQQAQNKPQDISGEEQAWILAGKPEMAQYTENHTIPGVSKTQIAVPGDVRSQLNAQTILDNKGKDLLGYVQQHTGSWNPQTRAIATQKIEEMKNFYNDSIKGGALTQGRLGWYDEQFAKNPTDVLPQIMGSTAKLKEMVRSNQSRMNQTVKSYGGNSEQKPDASLDQAPEQKSAVSKSGRPITFKDGKWVYK